VRELRSPGGTLRILAEQAFTRAAGAPLVEGNAVRLLRDATENFPAWLAAIEGARESVLFEMYIFAEDEVGERFARVLAAKARAGVRVRVLRDWVGGLGEASHGFWRRLSAAGVEVRTFNPPRLDSPFGWLGRDHRKCIVVDGEVGFVTGLCVAARWSGDPDRGREPWRDTGVEIRGPAVADLARAFADAWDEVGPAIPADELPRREVIAPAGDVALRVVATVPSASALYRVDHLVAAISRRTLWITDAYYVGTASYVQALRAAARDGVDVRLLVPGESDLGVVKRLSIVGYRPLLEAGVRIFEWSGPMLHAKTAVADGRWARVGSSNLNLSSWLANWELDVAVEDERFAREMERVYEEDLSRAVEIVLERRRVRPVAPLPPPRKPPPGRRPREGSAVAAAGALRLGNAVSAALGGYRVLGPAEVSLLVGAALGLLALAAVAILWPRVAATPPAVLLLWFAIALLAKARKLRREERRRAEAEGREGNGNANRNAPNPTANPTATATATANPTATPTDGPDERPRSRVADRG
jgi:cardiolipin synthase